MSTSSAAHACAALARRSTSMERSYEARCSASSMPASSAHRFWLSSSDACVASKSVSASSASFSRDKSSETFSTRSVTLSCSSSSAFAATASASSSARFCASVDVDISERSSDSLPCRADRSWSRCSTLDRAVARSCISLDTWSTSIPCGRLCSPTICSCNWRRSSNIPATFFRSSTSLS